MFVLDLEIVVGSEFGCPVYAVISVDLGMPIVVILNAVPREFVVIIVYVLPYGLTSYL